MKALVPEPYAALVFADRDCLQEVPYMLIEGSGAGVDGLRSASGAA